MPLAQTVAYVNFDVLGSNLLPSLRNTTFAVGAETGGPVLTDIVGDAVDADTLDTAMVSAVMGAYRSDYTAFLNASIPTVFFSDSTGPCYHTPGDDIDAVDFAKLDHQVATATRVVRALADGDERPTWTPAPLTTYDDVVAVGDVMDRSSVDWGRFSAADQQTLNAIRSDLTAIRDCGTRRLRRRRPEHPAQPGQPGDIGVHPRHLRRVPPADHAPARYAARRRDGDAAGAPPARRDDQAWSPVAHVVAVSVGATVATTKRSKGSTRSRGSSSAKRKTAPPKKRPPARKPPSARQSRASEKPPVTARALDAVAEASHGHRADLAASSPSSSASSPGSASTPRSAVRSATRWPARRPRSSAAPTSCCRSSW